MAGLAGALRVLAGRVVPALVVACAASAQDAPTTKSPTDALASQPSQIVLSTPGATPTNPPARPTPPKAIQGRLLQVFDFEERATNPGRVPRFWYRAQDSEDRPREGFPRWNLARLAYTSDAAQGSGGEPIPDHLRGPVLAMRGEGALVLPTRGGGTSLLLDAGAIPVFPDTDYNISVHVRTRNLVFARAALIVRTLASDGTPIEGSERVSELVTSPDGWRELTIRTTTNQPGAAFLQVEVVVLQPRQVRELFPSPQRPADAFRINDEDLDGQAWFDDLTVLQLPRVSLQSPKGLESNVLLGPAPPTFDVVVRDLANERLTLQLDALDADGVVTTGPTHQLGTGTANLTWKPTLPAFGWYRLRMRLRDAGGHTVGGTFTDFVWLPAHDQATQAALEGERVGDGVGTRDMGEGTTASVASDDRAKAPSEEQVTSTRGLQGAASGRENARGMNDWRRFALSLEHAPTRHLMATPALLEQTGMNVVSLPLWTSTLDEDDIPGHTRTLQLLVRNLVGEYVDVSIAMPRLPDTLAERSNIATNDVASIFTRPSTEWLPFAQDPLEKLGALTGRWQVGIAPADAGFFAAPSLAALSATRTGLGRFVPGLTLAIPTSLSQDWNPATLAHAAGPARLLMHVPSEWSIESLRSMASQRMANLAAEATSRGVASRELAIQWQLRPDATDALASPRQRAARVSQQLVELWRLMGDQPTGTGASGMSTSMLPMSIAMIDPWRFPENDRESPRPTPEFAAFLFARSVLADARVVGTFPAPEGITSYILSPRTSTGEDTRGWLIAWNESADPAKAFIDMPVGARGLEVLDIFGNATRLQGTLGPDGVSRTARIPVSQQPVFVRGIDTALAQFLASIAITPPLLDAAAELGEHRITLRNPWPQSISGKVSILEPGGFDTGERDRSWRINPRTFNFSLSAGGSRDLVFTTAFRATEEAGPKRFLLGIDVSDDLPYGVLRVERELELGLDTFRVDTSHSVRGNDVVVECLVTNTTTTPLTLEVTALAPGLPRSRATIPELLPGAQAIRRFTYPGAANPARPAPADPSTDEGGSLLNKRVVFIVTEPDTGERLTRSVAIE